MSEDDIFALIILDSINTIFFLKKKKIVEYRCNNMEIIFSFTVN